MKPIDLTKTLKPYKSGWVAISLKEHEVMVHAKNFLRIAEKVKGRKDIVLMPASRNYFGFITNLNG